MDYAKTCPAPISLEIRPETPSGLSALHQGTKAHSAKLADYLQQTTQDAIAKANMVPCIKVERTKTKSSDAVFPAAAAPAYILLAVVFVGSSYIQPR